MNLNLSSVFSSHSSTAAFNNSSKSIDFNKVIRATLSLGLVVLMILTSSYVEYLIVAGAIVFIQSIYNFQKDLKHLDLNFNNEDLELNEIINDLWE